MILGQEDLAMQVKADLMKQFECDDCAQLDKYIGNKIDYVGSDAICFVQTVLLQGYSDEFNLKEKCHNTPAIPGTVLKKQEDNRNVLNSKNQTILRSGIGKLMHNMQYSCPDIAQAVRDLVRHMTCVDVTHMQGMLRCMQYLKCTKDAGLLLEPMRKWDRTNDFLFKIRGRSDSDYTKCTRSRRSVLIYMVFLEDAPVMHQSATQKTVVLSAIEAEINAAVLCVQDMLCAKNLIKSIRLKVELLMILEVDNKGAVDIINSFGVGGRTRHINVRQCFL
jgi:hypothetical protein